MGAACARRDSLVTAQASVPSSPPCPSTASRNGDGARSSGAVAGVKNWAAFFGAEVTVARCTEEALAITARRADNISNVQAALVQAGLTKDLSVAKYQMIGGRLLAVVDGLVPEGLRQHLFESMETDAFRRVEFARPDTRSYVHNVVDYNVDSLRRGQLMKVLGLLIKVLFPSTEGQLEVYRIYTNAVTYGDVAFSHQDSNCPRSVTVILYPNPEWSSEMGGETIFYDDSGEIAAAVEPKPGRIAAFHGAIWHKGSPPSRLFWDTRYTMAFKFAP